MMNFICELKWALLNICLWQVTNIEIEINIPSSA